MLASWLCGLFLFWWCSGADVWVGGQENVALQITFHLISSNTHSEIKVQEGIAACTCLPCINATGRQKQAISVQ